MTGRKVVLITGGSRGIGRACVEAFARAGWAALFFCRARADLAAELASRLRGEGCDAGWYQCDVSKKAEVDAAVSDILRRYHHIDALVNNAAVSQTGLMTDLSEEAWDGMFAVNAKGAFLCAQAVLPGMIGRKSGSIVNISSMWGQTGASCEVCYSATKAALIGFTKALAQEVGPSGVRVNCVAPGVIDTDMNAALDEAALAALADETPLGRIGSPAEIARAVLFLAGDEASFITGQVLGVNGGFTV
ncbi:MAG: 3-oxoacyl-ACP reductase FabG [Clostridia bacterium]|nr:3-oxoacyl-ACP reductase FabG [Clostridia bacterium]MBO4885671.1 3-oxoacyl-ACP reductase FabG [Clostridia bacterium]